MKRYDRYIVDPSLFSTEKDYIERIEVALDRKLDYDEWELARTQWSKEWA